MASEDPISNAARSTPVAPEAACGLPSRWYQSPWTKRALVVLLVLLTQWPILQAPWGRDLQGINGGFFGLQARNLSRMELDQTLLGGVLNTGDPGEDPPIFYLHHPPLMIWILALSRQLFGDSEWAFRLPILAAFAGCAIFVLSLGGRWLRGNGGLAAALLFVLLPAADAFGMHVDVHGPITLLPALGIISAWDRLRSGDRRAHPWMLFWMTAGVLTDWPICYLPLILWLHAVGTRAGHGLQRALFVHGVIAAGFLVLVLAHMAMAQGGLGFLFEQLAHRTFHMKDDHAAGFSTTDWLIKEGRHLRVLFSIPVLVMVLLWLLPDRRPHPIATPPGQRAGIGLLLIFGAMDVLVGLQASYVHDAWSIFLWPGVALAATSIIWRMNARPHPVARWAALAGLVIGLKLDTPDRPPAEQLDAWAGHSCLDLARVVRSESRANEAVIVPGQWDCPPALYFYADRMLAPFVSNPKDFSQALAGEGFYGPLGFPAKSRKAVVAAVLPAHAVKEMTESGLIPAMEARGWTRTERGRFVVYRPRTAE